MNAKELRLGNIIGRKFQCRLLENECDILDIIEIVKKSTFYDFYEIPLTEKWLKKFGFVGIKREIRNYEATYHISAGDSIIRFHLATMTCLVNDCAVECKYVHTLQNLYFALTGFELEIITK